METLKLVSSEFQGKTTQPFLFLVLNFLYLA